MRLLVLNTESETYVQYIRGRSPSDAISYFDSWSLGSLPSWWLWPSLSFVTRERSLSTSSAEMSEMGNAVLLWKDLVYPFRRWILLRWGSDPQGGETTAWWLWSNMVNQLEANADCKLVLSLRRPRVQRVTRQPTTPPSTPPINTTRARWFSHQH